MDPTASTPLLEYFRRADVPREIRMLAATGEIAPRAVEQLALLVLLTGDGDPEVARAASDTLSGVPDATLASLIRHGHLSDDLVAALRARGILPAHAEVPAVDVAAPLVDTCPSPRLQARPGARGPLIQELSIIDRLKLAMKGTREQRAVLIRDPHKVVAVAVLSAPQLTLSEVESFARMGHVSSDVLRIIGTSRVWTKYYAVSAALVRNPKTPQVISLGLLQRLTSHDLRLLARDRNIPETLRFAAKKLVETAESRRS